MDFLDSFALPQSHEHLVLLKYLMVLTFTLFVPYLSILIGASLFSIILKRKSANEKDSKYIRLARDIVNIATFNKSVVLALGIIPLISALFCYMQLLQNSSASVLTFLLLAFLSFIIGIVLLFIYKNSFNLKTIFEYVGDSNLEFQNREAKEAFSNYRKDASQKYQKMDVWSLVFFVLTALFFVSAIEHASNSAIWGTDYSILSSIFSVRTMTYLLYILISASAVTLIVALFYYYKIKTVENIESEYLEFAREFIISKALVLTILLPVLVLVNLVFTPQNSLAYFAFVFTLLLLTTLLLIATFLYVMMKDRNSNYSTVLIALTVLLFVFANARDQVAFSTGSKVHLADLEANYLKYEEDFKSSLGLETITISGEDIFNGKCTACHRFDTKLVGPSYNEVLPKYTGDQESLVQFILNPVKINPDYPAMPNQGLKPQEARAVADYLLETYKNN